MTQNTLKKSLVGILIIALIVPATLFVKPKKTDAFISCFLGGLLGQAQSQVTSIASRSTDVPVFDSSNLSVNASNLGENKAQSTKECVLDFLVSVLADTLIQQFTSSVVNWINSGFHGSPSFVTNPEGFFLEVGDIAIGRDLEKLGAIGELLCSGFDLDLRLALGINYSSSNRQYVGCRLSDVQKNIMNSWTGGSFGGKAGWDNWFSINTQKQNNPYGTYFTLTNQFDASIVKAENSKVKELEQGKGFLSYKKCPSGGGEEARKEDVEGKCEVVTPGSVIESQLNNSLNLSNQKLAVADEINEIIGALINQGMKQVMSATGLSGGSSRSYGGGRSYVDQYSNSNFSQNIDILTTTKLPEGISLSCSEYHNNSYELAQDSNYPDAPYSGSVVKVSSPTYNNEVLVNFSTPVNTAKADGTPWTGEDLRKVDAYCQNLRDQDITLNLTGDQRSDYSLDYTQDNSTNPVQKPSYNLAIRKQARQSSTYSSDYPPNLAVDGNTYSRSVTGSDDSNSWWEVTLDKRSFIEKINIYALNGYDYALTGNIKIEISDVDATTGRSSVVKTLTDYYPSIDVSPWVIDNINVIGNKVRIYKTNGPELSLAEVEIMGRDNDINQTGNAGGSGQTPLELTLDPSTQKIQIRRNALNTSGSERTGTIALSTNKNLSGLTITATLRRRNTLEEFGRLLESNSYMNIVEATGEASALNNHLFQPGVAFTNTPVFSLASNKSYLIQFYLNTTSYALFEKYELKLEIKNTSGVVLKEQTTEIEIVN